MQTLTKRLLLGMLAFGLLCFAAGEAQATLPKPIQIKATLVFVDQETHTVVAKAGKDKKPFVLDWNKDTEFIRNGETATAAALKRDISVVIHYKDLSFGNPLLKKVIWEDKADAK